MSAFIYNNGPAKEEAVHQAEVPAGIKSKASLLQVLSVVLRFPAYFGGNWDALDECIRGLSWLPPGDVLVSHRDLPLSEDRVSLSTYLAILRDAVENWNRVGSNLTFASSEKPNVIGELESVAKRRLFVTFPLQVQGAVERALANEQGSDPLSGK